MNKKTKKKRINLLEKYKVDPQLKDKSDEQPPETGHEEENRNSDEEEANEAFENKLACKKVYLTQSICNNQ